MIVDGKKWPTGFWLRTFIVLVLGTLYVSLFWFHPPASWPQWMGASRAWLITQIVQLAGLSRQDAWVISGVLFGGLLPTIFLLGWRGQKLAKRFIFLGPGRKIGWRYVLISYLVALGPLLWLASRPSFRHYYANTIDHGLASMSLRFALVLIAEHICIQGLILVLALPDKEHQPLEPAAVLGDHISARLRRLLTLGPDWSLRSFELNVPVLMAISVQAWVFGWVHFSKDLGELALSFPGGFALGYLAWRARSVWPCVVLHAATGLTVIVFSIVLY